MKLVKRPMALERSRLNDLPCGQAWGKPAGGSTEIRDDSGRSRRTQWRSCDGGQPHRGRQTRSAGLDLDSSCRSCESKARAVARLSGCRSQREIENVHCQSWVAVRPCTALRLRMAGLRVLGKRKGAALPRPPSSWPMLFEAGPIVPACKFAWRERSGIRRLDT